jgi:hypothetical protein
MDRAKIIGWLSMLARPFPAAWTGFQTPADYLTAGLWKLVSDKGFLSDENRPGLLPPPSDNLHLCKLRWPVMFSGYFVD